MSQVSSVSQGPVTSLDAVADATIEQLKKTAVKFVNRLKSKPDDPTVEDAGAVRKWVELARGDVVGGRHRVGLY